MPDTFLYERMIRIESPRYICRVWTKCDYNDDGGLGIKTNAMNTLQWLEVNPLQMSQALGSIAWFDSVNSVEIIERDGGCGLCVHKNWP